MRPAGGRIVPPSIDHEIELAEIGEGLPVELPLFIDDDDPVRTGTGIRTDAKTDRIDPLRPRRRDLSGDAIRQ